MKEDIAVPEGRLGKWLGWGCMGTDRTLQRPFLEHQEGEAFKPKANQTEAQGIPRLGHPEPPPCPCPP